MSSTALAPIEYAEIAKTTLDYINAVKWPVVGVGLAVYFSKPISGLLARIQHGKVSAGSAAVEFDAKVAEVKRDLAVGEEVAEEILAEVAAIEPRPASEATQSGDGVDVVVSPNDVTIHVPAATGTGSANPPSVSASPNYLEVLNAARDRAIRGLWQLAEGGLDASEQSPEDQILYAWSRISQRVEELDRAVRLFARQSGPDVAAHYSLEYMMLGRVRLWPGTPSFLEQGYRDLSELAAQARHADEPISVWAAHDFVETARRWALAYVSYLSHSDSDLERRLPKPPEP